MGTGAELYKNDDPIWKWEAAKSSTVRVSALVYNKSMPHSFPTIAFHVDFISLKLPLKAASSAWPPPITRPSAQAWKVQQLPKALCSLQWDCSREAQTTITRAEKQDGELPRDEILYNILHGSAWLLHHKPWPLGWRQASLGCVFHQSLP